VLSFAQGYFHALLAKKVRSSPQLIEAIELDLQEHMAIESAAQTQVLQKSRRSLTAFAHALNMEGSFANSYAQPIRGDVLSWSETQASSRASGKNRNEHDFESDLPGEFDPVSLVNFAKGSKALSAKEKKKIAADLRRIKEPFELTVVGYEDESYLEDLGRKRAEVIESYLLSLGVKAQEVRLQFEPFTEFRSKPSRLEPISAKIIWHRLIEPERLRQSARPALKDPKRVERDLSDLGKAPLGTQAVLEAKAHENSGLIKAGELIHEGLERFANAHHWTLLWQMKWDWKAVADIDLSNERDVVQGVSKVILALRQEGHVLELRVYEDNHVLEVVSSEVFNE
jgi:outer membrane protein OmpA-like peptidoglycan-associated protein